MSPKQLLYSLAWIVPLIVGALILFASLFIPQSWRASNQPIRAYILYAIGIITMGLGALLLDYGYSWTSAGFMPIASISLLIGLFLMLRYWL